MFKINVILLLIGFILSYSIYFFSTVDDEVVEKLKSTKWDYIIIGGGTSGSVITYRLYTGFKELLCVNSRTNNESEIAQQMRGQKLESNYTNDDKFSNKTIKNACLNQMPNILLIEAGPDLSWLVKQIVKIPLFTPVLYYTGILSYYRTVPQKNLAGQMENNEIILPNGRVIGGTGISNAMIFSLGHPEDKFLERLLKLKPDILDPYYKNQNHKSRCQLYPEVVQSNPVNRHVYLAFKNAFENYGIYNNESYSRWSYQGIYKPLVYVRNHERISSYSECLEAVIGFSDHLLIAHNLQVDKLLFDAESKDLHVIGIQGRYKNDRVIPIYLNPNSVKVKPEIILSAGTIGTVEILLNSGIGPEQIYKNLNTTEHRLHSNVGQNVYDHPTIGLVFSQKNGTTIMRNSITFYEILKYYLGKESLISQASALSFVAFLQTSKQLELKETRPDIMVTAIAANPFDVDTFKQLSNFQPEVWKLFSHSEGNTEHENPMIFLVTLLNPKSRGSITIESIPNSNETKLLINPNYLNESIDMERMIEGVEMLYNIANFESQCSAVCDKDEYSLKSIGLKMAIPTYPNCPPLPNVMNSRKDFHEIIKCLIKSVGFSNYHLVGGCAMNSTEINGSVVSSDLRLIGIRNLRIGDASVLDEIPSGGPATIVMTIGNYLSHLILQETLIDLEKETMKN